MRDGSFTLQNGTEGSDSNVTTFSFRFLAFASLARYSGLGGSARRSKPVKPHLKLNVQIKVCDNSELRQNMNNIMS